MTIICLSDTHTRHRKARIPEGDLLIHGGDISNGRPEQVLDFLDWLNSQPHRYKVFIGGNMDQPLEDDPDQYRSLLPEDTFYLENESLELEGFKLWGSPMVPRFIGAFNRERGVELQAHWDRIPATTDMLITHTPPYGILDRTSLGMKVGCKDLLDRVQDIQPAYHLFGHVHEAYGKEEHGKTIFMNASFFRNRWSSYNEPFVFEL